MNLSTCVSVPCRGSIAISAFDLTHMQLLAIVGYSDSGKTGLIQSLVCELKRRGVSVAVIKHCPHGFDLDREGTDSWRFQQAGTQGVALLSPKYLAVLRALREPADARTVAQTHFHDLDVVLVEGGKKDRSIPKIWVRAEGEEIGGQVEREDIVAVVADEEMEAAKPVFQPGMVQELADFVLRSLGPE